MLLIFIVLVLILLVLANILNKFDHNDFVYENSWEDHDAKEEKLLHEMANKFKAGKSLVEVAVLMRKSEKEILENLQYLASKHEPEQKHLEFKEIKEKIFKEHEKELELESKDPIYKKENKINKRILELKRDISEYKQFLSDRKISLIHYEKLLKEEKIKGERVHNSLPYTHFNECKNEISDYTKKIEKSKRELNKIFASNIT